MLAGSNVVNLTLRGPTDAVIDGQGWPWWANFSAGTLAYQRPKLLEISDCNGLTVEGLTIQNSPFWTTHPIFCNDVTFRGVTVLAPRPVGNTDGIDPNSCSNVLIDSCHIDVGDDGISVKSGFREDGTLVPTANVLIRNTTVLSRNVAIGSACFGGIFNVTMVGGRIGDDGNADGIGSAPWAVKIKTHHPNGGIVRNITFDSVRFGRITPNPWQQAHGGYAINIMEEYGAVHPFVATPAIPHTALEDITFRNISCPYAVIPATFDGESDALITRLTLDNVQFATTTRPWGCSDMTQTVANNVQPPLPSSCGQN
jgi:polygalacturonase